MSQLSRSNSRVILCSIAKFVTLAVVTSFPAIVLDLRPATAQTLSGRPGDIRVQGDFDGDGVLDYAYWRPSNGTWYIRLYANPSALIEQQWGLPGDIPVPGNYSGTVNPVTGLRITDYAVWRPSNGTWYVKPANGAAPRFQQWGVPGDIPIAGDFDGDGITDFAVWRPSNGTWYVIPSASPAAPQVTQWGLPGDAPVPGDYDGDGRWDPAVYRSSNGTWYVIPSASPGTTQITQWGLPGDVPAPADYDLDGKNDFAVYRPTEGNMYLKLSSNPANPITQAWTLPTHVLSTKLSIGNMGRSLCVRVNGDFDGDGELDWGLWCPATGMWFVVLSSNSSAPALEIQWGLPGDVPVPADFDGDSKTDFVVWRPSNGTWYVLPVPGGASFTKQWGLPGDLPPPGPVDFDRDGKPDYAVWRPSNGTWFIIPSSTGAPEALQWGLLGDIPVAGEYVGGDIEATNPTIWRPSNSGFYVRTAGNPIIKVLGLPGDLPVAADINNDGGTDYAVWRPSAQSWFYVVNGSSGSVVQIQLGFAGNELLYNEPPITTFIGAR